MSVLSSGRRAALRRMTDQVQIHGPDTLGPINPATGKKPTVPGPLRYSGPAKIQSFEGYAASALSGQHMYTTQQHRVDLPLDAGPVFAEDIVTVTASLNNPHLVGARSLIAGPLNKSAATAQRLQCTRIVA